MWCYYNHADEVELFINGKSQGVRRKATYQETLDNATEYHVVWRVTFEPGEVKVVARKDGRQVGEQTIRTAGAPDHIQLAVDYRGDNTTFIEAQVVDKDGNLCPRAENQLFFETNSTAEVIGVDNGNAASLERYKANDRKAFFGKALIVAKGYGTLTAKAADLKAATLSF